MSDDLKIVEETIYEFIEEKTDEDRPTSIEEKIKFPDPAPIDRQTTSNPEGEWTAGALIDVFAQHQYADLELFNKPDGTFTLYDPKNPDRLLMDVFEQELIELSTSPIKYYKYLPQSGDVDAIYGEQRIKRNWAPPIIIYGIYEDPSTDQAMVAYGLQETEEIEITFNYVYLMHKVGDQIQVGDILQTHEGKFWEVVSSLVGDQDLWKPIHNVVIAKRLYQEGIVLPDYGDISMSGNIPIIKDDGQ